MRLSAFMRWVLQKYREIQLSTQRCRWVEKFFDARLNGSSIVTIDRSIRNYLNQFHHAAIFVRQNVAVEHILAGKISKPGTHDEIARNSYRACRITAGSAGCVWPNVRRTVIELRTHRGLQWEYLPGRDGKNVPPDKILWRISSGA